MKEETDEILWAVHCTWYHYIASLPCPLPFSKIADRGDVPSPDANNTKPVTTYHRCIVVVVRPNRKHMFHRCLRPLLLCGLPPSSSNPGATLAFSDSEAFGANARDEPGRFKVLMNIQRTNVNVMRVTDKKGPTYDAIGYPTYNKNGDYGATVGDRGRVAVWDIENLY